MRQKKSFKRWIKGITVDEWSLVVMNFSYSYAMNAQPKCKIINKV